MIESARGLPHEVSRAMPVGISGIEIAEQNGADHAIERLPTGVTAFVGRALKGPVNRAVAIKSFAEFQSVFGLYGDRKSVV